MNKTTNYELNKPEVTDVYDVNDFNDNMDIIDEELNNLSNDKLDKTGAANNATVSYTSSDTDDGEASSWLTVAKLVSDETLKSIMEKVSSMFSNIRFLKGAVTTAQSTADAGKKTVNQTNTTTSKDYRVLFSENANDTTQMAEARKSANFKYNPSSGNLQVTKLNGATIGSSPKFSDTVKGNGLSTYAAQIGTGSEIDDSIPADTSMDDAIGALLNNDHALNLNKEDKLFLTCSTARNVAAKVVDCTGFNLVTGARIAVRFTDTGSSNPSSDNLTLNVNATGAKTIVDGHTNKTALTYTSAALFYNNMVAEFIYDGTYWVYMNRDKDTTYSSMSTTELVTGTASTARTVRADYLNAGIRNIAYPPTAPIEASATSVHPYDVGDYFIYNGILYQCTVAITSGGTITPGTNCEATNVASELTTLNSDLSALIAIEEIYVDVVFNNSSASNSVVKSVAKTGYKPVGVVGWYQGTGAHVFISTVVIFATDNTLHMNARRANNDAGSGTVRFTIYVLYTKNV